MKAFFERIVGNRKQPAEQNPVMRTTSDSQTTCEAHGCKILVVCKGDSFSDGMADYAVDMARKTRSSLVALSLDESGRTFEQFSAAAAHNVEYFAARASEAGIAFEHEIRQGSEEAIVAQMHDADPQFRYVMDDTAAVCKSRGSIPVYTRATLRAK